jgi:hypothetical protein
MAMGREMEAEGVRLTRLRGPAGPGRAGPVLLLAAALLAAGCESLPEPSRQPPPHYEFVDVDHATSARALALELGMKLKADPAVRSLALEGEQGRIVFVADTRTIMVAGKRLEAGETLVIAGGDIPLRADDATGIRKAWLESVAEQRTREAETGPPVGPQPPPDRRGSRGPAVAGADPAWRVPLTRRWDGILIHHSGADTGNMARIDKFHREVNGWLGIGYDFLIDNGDGAPDGLVETTFRWKQQIQGAHAGHGLYEYNDHWVGICLVGDFNETRPTPKQMKSLKTLVRFLQSYCGMPDENIRMHRDVRETDCPGRMFPLRELQQDFPRAK